MEMPALLGSPAAPATGLRSGFSVLRAAHAPPAAPPAAHAVSEGGAERVGAGPLLAAGAFVGAALSQQRRGRGSVASRRAASGTQDGDKSKDSTSFKFDSDLAARFLEITEPYFVPTDKEGGGGFGPLLLALLVGVAGFAFLAFLGALKAVAAVPFLAALIPGPGAEAKFAELAQPLGIGLASAGAGTCGAVFFSRKEDLEGRWTQWGFLSLLIFLLLFVTGINVAISFVFRSIDNVLVAKNEEGFYQNMQLFIAVLVVALPTIAGYRFTRQTLANRWREFLTTLMLDKYFAARTYYMLDSNSTETNIDNPDQRISEDVDSFTAETLGFLLDILGSLSNLISFSAILWATSEQLTYALIAYAFVGTAIALAVGGELISINYKQLRLQADFRYSLVHVRDNAEAIAFYQGEARERDGVVDKLTAAVRNFDRVIQWNTGLTLYQRTFFYVARLVPYFVAGGLYFAGKVDFGTFGQVSFAFSMVLSSVTLIVSRIQDISRFSAGVNRLGTFYEAIMLEESELPAAGAHEHGRISTLAEAGAAAGRIVLDDVTLETPTGRTLVENVSLKLGSNAEGSPLGGVGAVGLPSRLLVVGSSGVGKSSILRAIAGLWTQGTGSITRPEIGKMLFLPQKPYMPLGDLRLQLLYPSDASERPLADAALVEVLSLFGLGDLPTRFEGGFSAVQDWTRVLSLGEQQRLAAARCLIAGPKVAVLDEATSALPVPDEQNLYRCLQDKGISYVSVGHRASLLDHHDMVLELTGNGGWRLMSPRDFQAAMASSSGSRPAMAA